jgi:hypothetical protein
MGTEKGRILHEIRQRVRPYDHVPSRSEIRRLAIQEECMSMIIPFPGTVEREPGYDLLDGVEGPNENELIAIEAESLDDLDDQEIRDAYYESIPEDWDYLPDITNPYDDLDEYYDDYEQ